MDFTKKESQIVILRIFCQLFPSPPSLYAPHKAFSVHQECMQTQTGTVTQQREDDVEISHHTLLFTCHPAGPAAKTDLSSWHMSALNFTNSPSTQKTSAAEWFWANRWGELTISAKTHTAGPCTLASAEARSHRHTATWYTDVYMHEHAVYSPTLAWMHYVDAFGRLVSCSTYEENDHTPNITWRLWSWVTIILLCLLPSWRSTGESCVCKQCY